MSRTVSFVVPTFKRPAALQLTLEALLSVDYPVERYEIVVVDDSGGGEAAAVIRALSTNRAPLRYVAQANLGAASARNRGAHLAEGELLVFCDDDAIVEPSHIRQHLATQRDYERAWVAGVSRFYGPARATLEGTPFGRYRLDLEERFEAEADTRDLGAGRAAAEFLSARNLAVRRDDFFALGGFDEGFPYAGAEDQDLSYRARAAGYSLIRDHTIVVLNNEPTVTLGQFCMREERSAHTAVVLARKHPEVVQRPIIKENARISRTDTFRTRLKKTVKSAGSRRLPLKSVSKAIQASERLPLSDRRRRRLYSALISLHIFKGVRSGYAEDRDSAIA
jgi:GT2 family glycosyltransferase